MVACVAVCEKGAIQHGQ